MRPVKRHLVSIIPWSHSGLGCASAGLDLTWEDGQGEQTKETIQREEMSKEASILFPYFLAMYGEISKLASRRDIKRVKKKDRKDKNP